MSPREAKIVKEAFGVDVLSDNGLGGSENRPWTALSGFEPTLTKQSFASDCDINEVMSRYIKAGVVPAPPGTDQFMDVASVGDFRHAMDKVMQGRLIFEALPSAVRERFSNDPGSYLDFMSDSSNYDEAVRLGLVVPREDRKDETKSRSEDLGGGQGGATP